MTSQQILQSDFLDILFEKRNKMYGAYFLRRHYNEHLVKALLITGSLLLILFFFSGTGTAGSATILEPPPPVINITDVALPPAKQDPPQQKSPPSTPLQKVNQLHFTTKVNMVDDQTTPLATQEALTDALPGSENIKGDPATNLVTPPTPPSAGEGTTKTEAPPEKETLPSRQPQFPGGAQAWLNFLNTHLHAPQELEAGEKRTVLIRFSVDEEGTITNFQVVQSGGAAFDGEVIRVLKKMPKWLPAIQNGQPVAVSFTQPVTFFGQEE
jgi:periplasmic protein TonB